MVSNLKIHGFTNGNLVHLCRNRSECLKKLLDSLPLISRFIAEIDRNIFPHKKHHPLSIHKLSQDISSLILQYDIVTSFGPWPSRELIVPDHNPKWDSSCIQDQQNKISNPVFSGPQVLSDKFCFQRYTFYIYIYICHYMSIYIVYIRCLWRKTLGSTVVVLGSLDCFVVFSKTA